MSAPTGSVAAEREDDATGAVADRPRWTLAVAVLGFFVVTLDAVVVNVALPTVAADLGGGVSGLQWVVDGYTLMFAAFLLTAGAFCDRAGARRAFGIGLAVFTLASLACGAAPTLPVLVVARFVQGCAAAVMMPSSMALVSQAHPDVVARARAVGVWAMGGAVASSSGPVLGGLLTEISWRLIFLVNLPVGLAGLAMLARAGRSPSRPSPIDWPGQVTATLAMGGLTYAAIEAGSTGVGAPAVLAAAAIAVVAAVAFVVRQARARHPMVPLALLRIGVVPVSMAIGFAFMVGYYGMPFVLTLYLQQQRGMSAAATGTVFLPMMLSGLVLTPFTARIAERAGRRVPVVAGLLLMTIGLLALGFAPSSTSPGTLSALMVLVGLGGPLVMPPTMAALLGSVPGPFAGRASGLFNTSRQVGGALAVAVFGGLLAAAPTLGDGVRSSLAVAAAVVVLALLAAMRLTPRPEQ